MNPRHHTASAAVLWDESFLWGVFTRHALERVGLPYHVVTAAELSAGSLPAAPLFVVPGGWASQKSRVLGASGRDAIRAYVHRGGTYLGLCGGAGLALDVPGGLNLIAADRVPRAERVPSFAGKVRLRAVDPTQAMWRDLTDGRSGPRTSTFTSHVWWPSQLRVRDEAKVRVLATYATPAAGATTSDLDVETVERYGPEWGTLESEYGILLDPARLHGEPAILEGRVGAGRALVSMVHLDTPGDAVGASVLRRIWEEAGLPMADPERSTTPQLRSKTDAVQRWPELEQLEQQAERLIELGLRLFLWRQRNEYLLHWRRGVRGLEFCTIAVLVREIARLASRQRSLEQETQAVARLAAEAMDRFFEPACRMLVAESFQLQRERLTYRKCSNDELGTLREQLFSNGKSYGGLFKHLIDSLDLLLLKLTETPHQTGGT